MTGVQTCALPIWCSSAGSGRIFHTPGVLISGSFRTTSARAQLSTAFRLPSISSEAISRTFAALQGAILLIAAKRADQISAELAQHTFDIDKENLELTRMVADLTTQVHTLAQSIDAHIKAG